MEDWKLILPWGVAFLLILAGYISNKRDEKKFREEIERDMREWVEREFKIQVGSADRRGDARKGGRRTYDPE